MRITRFITQANRVEILKIVEYLPLGAWVEIVDDPQTMKQRRLMYALLGELSHQLEHCGEKYDKEAWKAAFLKASGRRLEFMPALDGEGVVAIGYHSSRLGKAEMSDLIERIYEYGARYGVVFPGPKGSAA